MKDLNRTEEGLASPKRIDEQFLELLEDFVSSRGSVTAGNRLVRFLLKGKKRWGLLGLGLELRRLDTPETQV